MKYHKWVPRHVAELHERLNNGKKSFIQTDYPPHELTVFAERNHFPTWQQYLNYIDDFLKCLGRLALDDNARLVWEWIGNDNEDAIALILSAIGRALEEWHKTPRLTKDEYKKECVAVAELADQLSRKLAYLYGNTWIEQRYPLLIPEKYQQAAIQYVHPKLVELNEKNGRNINKLQFVGMGIPPLHVLLKSLSASFNQIEPSPKTSRKARTKSALRQALLGRLMPIVHGFVATHSTERLALLLCLILDDNDISDATVRGDLNGTGWPELMKDRLVAGQAE